MRKLTESFFCHFSFSVLHTHRRCLSRDWMKVMWDIKCLRKWVSWILRGKSVTCLLVHVTIRPFGNYFANPALYIYTEIDQEFPFCCNHFFVKLSQFWEKKPLCNRIVMYEAASTISLVVSKGHFAIHWNTYKWLISWYYVKRQINWIK